MNYEQVSTFLFVLGSISSVDLVYFIKLTRSDTIFWTYSNTQLFLIIVGYLGYVLSTALVYNYVTVLMVAQTEIKVAYSISFLFVALAECAYLQHSWSTVKTVMNFKNKARCTGFDSILKFLMVLFFIPVVFLVIAFTLHLKIFYILGVVVIESVSAIVLVFDSFVFINLTKYFYSNRKEFDGKSSRLMLMAQFGVVSSASVILTVFCNAISLILTIYSIPVSNCFTVIGMVTLQVPIWALMGLKWKERQIEPRLTSAMTTATDKPPLKVPIISPKQQLRTEGSGMQLLQPSTIAATAEI